MSNRQRPDPMVAPTVADAEHAIGNLQAKRAALLARGKQLDEVRASNAFAALANGDAKARQRLDALNRETAEHGSELASIDAALKTATARLEAAQRAAAKAAQAGHAAAIREEWTAAQQDFADIDAGLSFAVGAMNRVFERYLRMQQHGLRPPPQLVLMTTDVWITAAMALPPPLWKQLNHQGLEHLPPNRKRSASSLADAWAAQTEQQAAAIGGEQQPNTSEVA